MTASTAYVLAAGLGTRLRPLTLERCKPLVEVCGTPLVEHALTLLARAGVTRVGINSHWLHPQLPAALGGRFGALEISYTHEPEVLGTGGGLRGLAEILPAPPGEKVLVLNADALIDVDLRALVDAARPDALATLVLKSVPDVDRYGALGTDAEGRVVDFVGRARVPGDVVTRRMFCGVHLVDPRAFSVLPPVHVECSVARGPQSGINDEGYPVWMNRGARIDAFDLGDATFCDVGTPERLLEANLALLSGVWSSAHLHAFDRFREIRPRVFVAPSARVHPGATLHAPVLVDDEAVIDAGAVVDGSVIGKRCRVESSARVVRSVLQSGAAAAGSLVDSIASATCFMGPLAPTTPRS